MKNLFHITLIVFFFGASNNVFACLPYGITFSSQEQIDNFGTNYPGCTEIEGNLTIEESSTGNITNLNGLSEIISIGGACYIEDNSALSSLTGLDKVTFIGESLWVINNSSLTNLLK